MKLGLAVLLTIGLGSVASAGPSSAEIEATFNPELAKCMDAAGGVTVEMRNCSAAELDRLDVVLNREYRAAMARLPSTAAKSRLRRDERTWLRVRHKHCASEAAPEEGGTLWLIMMDQCGLGVVAERIVWLRHYNGI